MNIKNPHTDKQHHPWQEKYGPWALVTGASDGIGREFARRLGRAGLNLVLVARRTGVLDRLAGEFSEKYGVLTKSIGADLTQDEDVDRVLKETADMDIGLLVASADFGTSGPLLDAPLEEEIEMLDVNCRSVLILSHRYGRRFAKRKRGGIVLMSSIVAFQGVPRAANYAATKAYVQTLAEGLRTELTPLGVDVIASAPGPVHSGFALRANMHMGMALQPAVIAEATLSALGRRTTVRPGWLSKVLEMGLTLPRWARIRIMTLVMGGMIKHQAKAVSSEIRGADV